MDLLQLEHFLAVVDERTFTRAAERVFRTQSAISQSVKRLEEELGAPLFLRDANDVRLTDSGRLLVEYARVLVRTRDDAMRGLGALKIRQGQTLTVAAHEAAAVYWLPPRLVGFLAGHPHVKLGVHRGRLDDIPQQVRDGAIDVGFVAEDPAIHELQAVEVLADEMMLVAPPGHPLTARGGVSMADLARERFVTHHHCPSHAIVARVFDAHRSAYHVVAELSSYESIKQFVQGGAGLAVVPGVTVARELRARTLARVAVRQLQVPRRTLMIFRERGRTEVAAALVEAVRRFPCECCEAGPAGDAWVEPPLAPLADQPANANV